MGMCPSVHENTSRGTPTAGATLDSLAARKKAGITLHRVQ